MEAVVVVVVVVVARSAGSSNVDPGMSISSQVVALERSRCSESWAGEETAPSGGRSQSPLEAFKTSPCSKIND